MTGLGAPRARAEETRAAIVDAALRLFREGGYEKTTMRAIAAEAGVSVGNAYYYFASKEHLVQSFYERIQAEHAAAVAPELARTKDFRARLVAAERAWLDVAAPYHEFAGKFFKVAAEPSSSLSPFSAESADARAASVAIMREVLDGSDLQVSGKLRPDLPELLWLYHLGVVLYWVHDRSPNQERTGVLIARTARLVERLLPLTRLPVLGKVSRDIQALVAELRPEGMTR